MKRINIKILVYSLITVGFILNSLKTLSQSVTIGNQIWQAKNLDVTRFRNGDPVPEVKSAEDWVKAAKEGKPAWCYFDLKTENGQKYGKLYNWHAVNDKRLLAPDGWHIPSDAEWTKLSDNLWGGENAGIRLKSSSGWNDYKSKTGNGSNASGFNALPGGYRSSTGLFSDFGDYCGWWSSTELRAGVAWYRGLEYSAGGLRLSASSEGPGLFVRCLKDEEAVNPQFVHPGMLNNRAELEFIKKKIASGSEPWKTNWELLKANEHAKLDWTPKPLADVIRGSYNKPNIGASDLGNDAQAAYIHSLEWFLSGDIKHAEKAIEIINAWSYTLKSITGSDMKLLAGITGYKFCNAAEIIKYTCNKWKKGDQEQFIKMMMGIYYPLIKKYNPKSNGNWDASMIVTTMCIGIFTENRELYNSAVEYAKTGVTNGAIPNYIYTSGQCQESGRDQGHTQLGLGYVGDYCEVAWKQGDDLYGAFDNRLASGIEYTSKYNLGFEVPYDSVPDAFGHSKHPVISTQSRGSFRPIYEKIYHHYHDAVGLEMKYTKMVLDKIRPEGYHWDHPSFGTLIYAGLPVFPKGYNKSK